jgi:hypothetical protein
MASALHRPAAPRDGTRAEIRVQISSTDVAHSAVQPQCVTRPGTCGLVGLQQLCAQRVASISALRQSVPHEIRFRAFIEPAAHGLLGSRAEPFVAGRRRVRDVVRTFLMRSVGDTATPHIPALERQRRDDSRRSRYLPNTALCSSSRRSGTWCLGLSRGHAQLQG